MTFLPVIMSKGILLLGKFRTRLTVLVRHRELADRETGGVLRSRSYGVISNAKVIEPSQILNGWLMYIEEVINPDISIA